MVIPLNTMITCTAVNRTQRSKNMTFRTVLLISKESKRTHLEVSSIRNKIMVDWRQSQQLFVPFIVIYVLRYNTRVSTETGNKQDDGEQIKNEEGGSRKIWQ